MRTRERGRVVHEQCPAYVGRRGLGVGAQRLQHPQLEVAQAVRGGHPQRRAPPPRPLATPLAWWSEEEGSGCTGSALQKHAGCPWTPLGAAHAPATRACCAAGLRGA